MALRLLPSDSLPTQIEQLPSDWDVQLAEVVIDVQKYRLNVASIVLPWSWCQAWQRMQGVEPSRFYFNSLIVFALIDAPMATIEDPHGR